MTIKPLLDRVGLKATEVEETTQSGFILTSASQEKPQFSEVVAVGPGGMVDGNEVKMYVSVGDKVMRTTVLPIFELGRTAYIANTVVRR